MMVYAATRQAGWIVPAGALLAMTSEPLMMVHLMAWSEPLFILLGFSGLLLLAVYVTRVRSWMLIASSVLIGLAFLTRYAGATFVFTGVLALIVTSRAPLRRRIADAVLFGALAALPMLLWMIRNVWVAGTATNREMVFHPISRSHLWWVVYTMSDWLMVPAVTPGILRLGLCLVVAAAAITGLREISAFRRQPAWAARTAGHLRFLLGLFIAVYGLFLVVSISLFDANTPLDNRILSPVYVAGLVLLLCGFLRVWNAGPPVLRYGMAAVLATYAGVSGWHAASTVATGRNDGFGFSGSAWQRSELIGLLRQLPPDAVVFSNAPDAVYLHTGHEAVLLPRNFMAANQQVNVHFEAELTAMKDLLAARRGMLAYFTGVPARASLPDEKELQAALPLCVHAKASDGTMYSVRPYCR
jgi:hypothetical protein